MEQKTFIQAEDGQQQITITRNFDLPLELTFKAFTEPEFVEEWMGTKVLSMDNKKLGSYQFGTTDPKGNKHRFSGTIHEFEPNKRITRTFEMVNTPFPVQLEFLVFEKLSDETSKLTMQVIYKSVEDRDNMLRLPFSQGINMAHSRLQSIMKKQLQN